VRFLHSWAGLEMLVGMQIKILNGGEILVNFKFKLNKNLDSNLYREIQMNNSTKISNRICTARYREIWFFSILTSWLKCANHSEFRFAFRRASSSRERAVREHKYWLERGGYRDHTGEGTDFVLNRFFPKLYWTFTTFPSQGTVNRIGCP